jgi:ABC-type transport system involved in multi-copper enzyme maturation permease subunit
MSWTRIRAIFVKELRDHRRNRFIMVTMALMPALFIVLPIVDIFVLPAVPSSAALDKRIGLSLLYMLIIPAVVPATLAAYSVVGEREQGTLEPVLTTPIRAAEFLLGKALAALVPTLVISYAMFGIFLAVVGLFAQPAIADAVFQAPHLLIQLLFTPLLAGWSIWVGIAISARSSDVRVAQQLGTLASLPPLAVTALLSFGVIQQSVALGLGLGAALLLVDVLGWRIVSAMFNRERLVTGTKS